MEIETEIREAAGYVFKLNELNKFVLEEQLLVEANRMIEQILSTEVASRSMICCGKVKTTLELFMEERLLNHPTVK